MSNFYVFHCVYEYNISIHCKAKTSDVLFEVPFIFHSIAMQAIQFKIVEMQKMPWKTRKSCKMQKYE